MKQGFPSTACDTKAETRRPIEAWISFGLPRSIGNHTIRYFPLRTTRRRAESAVDRGASQSLFDRRINVRKGARNLPNLVRVGAQARPSRVPKRRVHVEIFGPMSCRFAGGADRVWSQNIFAARPHERRHFASRQPPDP
jgi:hypothetical protein